MNDEQQNEYSLLHIINKQKEKEEEAAIRRVNNAQERVDFILNKPKYKPREYTPEDFDTFQQKMEGFSEDADNVPDEDKKNSTPTVGYGSTIYIDPETGKERKVIDRETWTKEQSLEQKDLYNQKQIDKIKQNGAKNFDQYPPGIKYAILDAAYNVKGTSFYDKSPKFWKAIELYDKSGDYDSINNRKQVARNMDWSRNATGNLPLRSRTRQALAVDLYEPSDAEMLDNLNHRDSLINAYDDKFQKLFNPL